MTEPSAINEPIGVDWRFLPGIPAGGRALVCHDDPRQPAEGLRPVFDLVITISETRPSAASIPIAGVRSLLASIDHTPFPPRSFDLVAFPDGLPGNIGYPAETEQEAYLRAARQLLRSDGALYLGFANKRGLRKSLRLSSPHPARRRNHRYRLKEVLGKLDQAGFDSLAVYAMIPNHRTPVYIAPLERGTLEYALKQYLRRSQSGAWLHHFIQPITLEWLQWDMPGYGIIAQHSNRHRIYPL